MNTTSYQRRTYRGKYPNNIRAVWSGKDRLIHIETMSGERFTCDGAHARSVNSVRLPNPGEDATPYRMPVVALRAVYLHSAGRTCMVFENPETFRWSDCMVMDDHGNAVIVSDDFPHGLHPDDVACEA